jgi:ABC-2 type transport system ATP-binding protein
MDPVVSVQHLAKAYGDLQAVADVSFDVHDGEIFGLLGPNGAGKTTTVECVQGLRRADGGDVRLLGLDPRTDADRLRAFVGSQLQESSLPHRMKVWEALNLFSSLQPGGPDWRTVMEEWGLTPKASASFGSLSGGQRQRLLVALALVNRPRLVFLDEVTTGLDPAARRATWDLIERIRDAGTTVVLVTHFMDEANRLCDRIAVVAQGRVVATGTPAELVRQHQDGVTVRFTGPATVLPALRALPGVREATADGPTVEVRGEPSIVPAVGKSLIDGGVHPDDMDVIRPTLEDVYLQLVDDGGDD